MQHILLVEDDAIIAMAEASILQRAGYKVSVAHTGERAIDVVSAAAHPPDLVLMDVDLGQGMDGTDAASAILKRHDIPVLFLSSHTEREMVEKTERISSYGYVVKHSGETVLLASISMAFRLHQAYLALKSQGEELRATNEKYSRSQRRARIGSWEHDFVHDHLWWSEGMYHLLGFPSGSPVVLDQVAACFPPHERIRFAEALKNALESGVPYSMEYTFIRPDGLEIKIHDEGEVVRDGQGRAIHMYGTTHDITEVWDAQEHIRQLSRSVEQSPATVVITDPHGAIEYVNPKFTETTGYAAAEVIGKNPRVLKSGEMSQDEYEQLWLTIVAGGEWRGEFHNRRKDGSLYWESASISPITDGSGKITHFVAVKEDITQRKAAETKLQESEARFRTMADSSPGMIWVTGPGGEVTMVNRAYREFFDVTAEELNSPGKWEALIPFEAEDGYIRAFSEASQKRAPFAAQARVRAADGRIRWVDSHASPRFAADGSFAGYVGSSIDITEAKAIKVALEHSEAKYKALVEGSPLGIFINQDMRIVYINPAGMALFGANDPSLILGRSPLELFLPEVHDVVRKRIADVLKGETVDTIEMPMSRIDGTVVEVEVVGHLIPYDGRSAIQVILRDLTEIRRTMQRLQESEEMFRTVTDLTPYHISLQDRELRYLMVVNPQLGFTIDDLIGKTDHDVLPREKADELTEVKRRAMATGAPCPFTTSVTSNDGKIETFDGMFVPRHNAAGDVDGVIGYFRNTSRES